MTLSYALWVNFSYLFKGQMYPHFPVQFRNSNWSQGNLRMWKCNTNVFSSASHSCCFLVVISEKGLELKGPHSTPNSASCFLLFKMPSSSVKSPFFKGGLKSCLFDKDSHHYNPPTIFWTHIAISAIWLSICWIFNCILYFCLLPSLDYELPRDWDYVLLVLIFFYYKNVEIFTEVERNI